MSIKSAVTTAYLEVNWNEAGCKDFPTNVFYNIEEKGMANAIDITVFRGVCASCPIWEQCLAYATKNEHYGVWGGMTSRERLAMWSNRGNAVKSKVFKDFAEQGISPKTIKRVMRIK